MADPWPGSDSPPPTRLEVLDGDRSYEAGSGGPIARKRIGMGGWILIMPEGIGSGFRSHSWGLRVLATGSHR